MKKSKWNELEIALLVLLAVCLLTGAMSLRNQDVLQQKMIRLHVVANSDSDRGRSSRTLRAAGPLPMMISRA